MFDFVISSWVLEPVINLCIFGGIPDSPPATCNLALRRCQRRYILIIKSNTPRITPMAIPPIAPFSRPLGGVVMLVVLLILRVVPLVALVVGVIVVELDMSVILSKRKISISVVS
jgi:hypothetical protein